MVCHIGCTDSFFSNVCSHMSSKITIIWERHTTQVALVWLFSRMWPQKNSKTFCLPECLQMNCKIFCVPLRLITCITLVRFCSNMSTQIVIKITFFVKALSHWLHWYGFSPMYNLLRFNKLILNDLSQWLHWQIFLQCVLSYVF